VATTLSSILAASMECFAVSPQGQTCSRRYHHARRTPHKL